MPGQSGAHPMLPDGLGHLPIHHGRSIAHDVHALTPNLTTTAVACRSDSDQRWFTIAHGHATSALTCCGPGQAARSAIFASR